MSAATSKHAFYIRHALAPLRPFLATLCATGPCAGLLLGLALGALLAGLWLLEAV